MKTNGDGPAPSARRRTAHLHGSTDKEANEIRSQLEEFATSRTQKMQRKLGQVMESTVVEWSIVFLVFAYALLVFAQISLGTDIQKEPTLKDILDRVDFAILVIFLIEIFLKTIAFGKPYICDSWNMFDCFIVVVSMGLSILQFVSDDKMLDQILGLRGILRLLRLIVIFRKVSETQSSASRLKSRSSGNITMAADRVLDTLESLQGTRILDRKTRRDLQFACRVIASGDLYEPVAQERTGGALDKEANAWINNASSAKSKAKQHQQQTPAEAEHQRGPAVLSMENLWSVSSEALAMLDGEKAGQWNYDMRKLDAATNGNSLPALLTSLMHSHNLIDGIIADAECWKKFIEKIRDSYHAKNPYHNSVHAADVTQSAYCFLKTFGLEEVAKLDGKDVFSVLFSAAIHDVDHPALNNVFQVKTRAELAIKYNDKAVLENHHVSFAYTVIAEEAGCNVFKDIDNSTYTTVRANTIAMVLSTDISKHFEELGKLKTKTNQQATSDVPFPDPEKNEDKMLVLCVMLHACDVSNPAKPNQIYLYWTNNVLQEFFGQGDKEKELGLPVSMFMDRATTNIAKCQVGFMDIIVHPLYQGLEVLLPDVGPACCKNIEFNKEFWKKRVDAMEAKMQAGDTSLPEDDPDAPQLLQM
eukprot:CAMPEP_0204369302 /NCGR_PEP_ID=MMETSP0469-20131031/44847_1 /ASSEMBLY_ACC=CAM_ASM_000384 /TAXON_ID=2969 /ORGANISM="Oxyrrhis marina" /LENGTH=643 /DNA_ID=CAMNT_0051359001 /DNA_START=44 /DNA_END=1975 /DNA_ORIENTATION=-